MMKFFIPLTFKDVFAKEAPGDYFALITKFPKNLLMAHLAFLIGKSNSYLNAVVKSSSIETHREFLALFNLPEEISIRTLSCIEDLGGAHRLIYSRDTILYGMEEILQSNLEDCPEVVKGDQELTKSLFCYLLCLNERYIKSRKLEGDVTIEQLNASILPVNNIPRYNSITLFIKGVRLFKKMLSDPVYKNLLSTYILDEYNCTVNQYIGFFLRWGESGTNIIIDEDQTEYTIFKRLSQYKMDKAETQRLSSVRISPVYQVSKNNFIILDKSLFLGKMYYQFIYEFWFNCVKINSISVKTYFGWIGKFFENYTVELLKQLFQFTKHPIPIGLSELNYKNIKGDNEFADFYARQNRKLVFAEIKLGNLSDEERYSGNVDGLYAKGEVNFYDCLRQLEDSINNLKILQMHFDPKLEVGRHLTIYPICVFNDKIYDFGFMKITFDKKWEEIRKRSSGLNIKPLIILQIEELESLVFRLNDQSKNISVWDALDAFCIRKKGARSFSWAKLENMPLSYPQNIVEELQWYLDVYKIS
ncbi:hypothetical protein WG904_03430 [Pedobacter sp. Du54]|uniref:hypothetical protein n=1 Tax=Pedobacter anseongensis TaxID=3133439 RepID=UPI0030993D13